MKILRIIKIYIIQCGNCKHIFSHDEREQLLEPEATYNFTCPKCKVIRLLKIPSDSQSDIYFSNLPQHIREIYQKYFIEKKGCVQTGLEVGKSKNYVLYQLRKYGFEPRMHKTANTISGKRRREK